MISATTGKFVDNRKKFDFAQVCDTKAIERISRGDGNHSYNVLRKKEHQKKWRFYKSAYTIEAAMKHYDNI
jgi:quinol monooxygenase YgiN